MSSWEDLTIEQRGGSPLSREVGDEGRAGCRHSDPSDSEATPNDDDQNTVVERGRVRDAAAGHVSDDSSHQRSRDVQSPHPSPTSRQQRSGSTVGSMAALPRLKSVVTKAVQLRLTGGRGRATSGSGVLRLCRPGRDDDNSTVQWVYGFAVAWVHME